jgi:CelD/BcsL family acetyltransferase involved in cellulose biosynthesis
VTGIQVSAVTDFAALGERWRDLERRANGSFFQSWSWTGCLAAERFADPVLVSATEAGRTAALALFNRVRKSVGPDLLYLGESGQPERDSPYIEHNGVLAESGREADLTAACVKAVAGTHVLVLSGIGAAALAAVRQAAGLTWIGKTSEAPYADLAALRQSGADLLASRSANTRQQVRRSDRAYAARGGLAVRRADSLAAAHAMLDSLAALHQAAWTARGQPGSFANPFFGRFHHALIETAFPRDEVALIEVRAGGALIGVLYNMTYRDRVYAYQSGFEYATAGAHEKPGLTCHHLAIREAMRNGAAVYDFLAGDDRYKRSLAGSSRPLFWIEAGPAWSPRLLARRVLRMAGR